MLCWLHGGCGGVAVCGYCCIPGFGCLGVVLIWCCGLFGSAVQFCVFGLGGLFALP